MTNNKENRTIGLSEGKTTNQYIFRYLNRYLFIHIKIEIYIYVIYIYILYLYKTLIILNASVYILYLFENVTNICNKERRRITYFNKKHCNKIVFI